MRTIHRTLLLFAYLGTLLTAKGQDTGTGQGSAPGDIIVVATHGSWQVRMIQGSKKSRQIYQLCKNSNGKSVVEISFFPLPAGSQAVAGFTAVTPLETLLPPGLTIQIDSIGEKKYPYAFATKEGCIVRGGITREELAALKKGKKGTISIVPVMTPNEPVTIKFSLNGFTKAFASLEED